MSDFDTPLTRVGHRGGDGVHFVADRFEVRLACSRQGRVEVAHAVTSAAGWQSQTLHSAMLRSYPMRLPTSLPCEAS